MKPFQLPSRSLTASTPPRQPFKLPGRSSPSFPYTQESFRVETFQVFRHKPWAEASPDFGKSFKTSNQWSFLKKKCLLSFQGGSFSSFQPEGVQASSPLKPSSFRAKAIQASRQKSVSFQTIQKIKPSSFQIEAYQASRQKPFRFQTIK